MIQSDSVIKIVVIGPESTGKSSLCATLADHYSTIWCREYAREYLLQHGMDYTYEDLQTIAKGQLALEDQAVAECIQHHRNPLQHRILFLDTDMYVMKVWCEFVFGKCHPLILNQIVQRKYDGYLLCKPDLPWIKDELREYPDPTTREKLYHIYKDLLANQSTPWYEVHGEGEQRSDAAVQWIDRLLNSK
ncbi:MAG: hypothetical protein RIQ50_185 [Bacteroidota bacterium]